MNLISLPSTEVKSLKESDIRTIIPSLKSLCTGAVIVYQPERKNQQWVLEVSKTKVYNTGSQKIRDVNLSTEFEYPTIMLLGSIVGWETDTCIQLTNETVDEIYNDFIPEHLKGILGKNRVDEVGLYVALHATKFRPYLVSTDLIGDVNNFLETLNTENGKTLYKLPRDVLKPNESFKAVYIPELTKYVVVSNTGKFSISNPTFILGKLRNAPRNLSSMIIAYKDNTVETRVLPRSMGVFDIILQSANI